MDFFTAPSPAAPSTLTWHVLVEGSTTRRTKLKEEEHNLLPRSSRAVSWAEMSRSPVHLRKTLRSLVGVVVRAADGPGEDVGGGGRPLHSFAHILDHVPHRLVPVQYDLEVDVCPPMRESKAQVC